MTDYWRECIDIAFDDAGITATDEQRELVAAAVAGGHENYGMAHGHDCIPNPLKSENDRLARKLKWERELEGCLTCGGRGRLTYNTGPWAVDTGCHRCGGSGKVHPHNEREPA